MKNNYIFELRKKIIKGISEKEGISEEYTAENFPETAWTFW